MQPWPCPEDLGGGFWQVLPFRVLSLMHSARGCVGCLLLQESTPPLWKLCESAHSKHLCVLRGSAGTLFAPLLPEPRKTI